MIHLCDATLHRLPLRARMPFRYGIVTMTEVPHVFLQLTFELDGVVQAGVAADHLPPKWLTKDPNRATSDEIDEMLVVIRAAVALTMVAASIPGRSVVRNAEIIKRAHPRFVENLRSLGADLEWK